MLSDFLEPFAAIFSVERSSDGGEFTRTFVLSPTIADRVFPSRLTVSTATAKIEANTSSTRNGSVVTDRDSLLLSILADPADDTLRLVFADQLRESGDEADRALGRFLWAGVVASQFRRHEYVDDPMYFTALAEIEAVIVECRPQLWLAVLGLGEGSSGGGNWLWGSTFDRVTFRYGATLAVFSRGMLAELTITWEQWLAVSGTVFVAWPLERINIADRPGLSFAFERTASEWHIAGRLKVPGRRIPLAGVVIPSAVGPAPFLTEEKADWRAEERFPDRAAMVAAAYPASARLMADLREVAGDRWPQPPQRRG